MPHTHSCEGRARGTGNAVGDGEEEVSYRLGEGGDCGSVYGVPDLGEETKVLGHSPSSPCSKDAEHSWPQVMPTLHGCTGLEKTHVLLVWQRGPGIPGT